MSSQFTASFEGRKINTRKRKSKRRKRGDFEKVSEGDRKEKWFSVQHNMLLRMSRIRKQRREV